MSGTVVYKAFLTWITSMNMLKNTWKHRKMFFQDTVHDNPLTNSFHWHTCKFKRLTYFQVSSVCGLLAVTWLKTTLNSNVTFIFTLFTLNSRVLVTIMSKRLDQSSKLGSQCINFLLCLFCFFRQNLLFATWIRVAGILFPSYLSAFTVDGKNVLCG